MDRRFKKCKFQTVKNSSFCCRRPWNSIERNVRNRIILTFTSVFFDYALEINCFVSSWTVFWYTNYASTESLWTVDSKNTNSRQWKIPVSAAEALKFNRMQCSKQHNINFHVSLFRLCTWNKLLCIFMDCLLIHELGINRKPMDRRF